MTTYSATTAQSMKDEIKNTKKFIYSACVEGLEYFGVVLGAEDYLGVCKELLKQIAKRPNSITTYCGIEKICERISLHLKTLHLKEIESVNLLLLHLHHPDDIGDDFRHIEPLNLLLIRLAEAFEDVVDEVKSRQDFVSDLEEKLKEMEC